MPSWLHRDWYYIQSSTIQSEFCRDSRCQQLRFGASMPSLGMTVMYKDPEYLGISNSIGIGAMTANPIILSSNVTIQLRHIKDAKIIVSLASLPGGTTEKH